MTSARMQPETQLLLRNADRVFREGPFVVVDPPDHATAEALSPFQVQYWCRNYAVARALPDTSPVVFGVRLPAAAQPYQTGIIFLPKGRRFQEMTFAQVNAAVGTNARIFVVGANQAGIKGARRPLIAAVGETTAVDAARRCGLLEAVAGGRVPSFSFEPWTQRWSVSVGPLNVEAETVAGTFSDGELDEGTAELMTAALGRPVGLRVLDMCCGGGVIGVMLAKANPDANVVLVDVHACALESTRRTIALNGLANASAYPSDWYSDVTGRFDSIFCNPPFHQGVATDTTMASAVIRQAANYLKPKGQLWLVANRFLPYLDELQSAFTSVTIERQTNRFRVYRCRAPVSAPSRRLDKRNGNDRKR